MNTAEFEKQAIEILRSEFRNNIGDLEKMSILEEAKLIDSLQDIIPFGFAIESVLRLEGGFRITLYRVNVGIDFDLFDLKDI